MSGHTFPIVDPDSGEVLAADEAERLEVVELLGGFLVTEAQVRERANAARRQLRLLMGEGDAKGLGGGYAVTVKPAASPARQVVATKLEEHREALTGLGLGILPRTETKSVTVNPKVSDIDNPKARKALATVDLTPETFLYSPERGDPQVVLVVPES